MSGNLDGKVAVVTGGGSGIGRATCLLFAREGAKVVVSDIDEANGQETAALIERAGGIAEFVPCDVSKPEDVASLMETAEKAFGSLTVLVNNAGWEGPIRPLLEYDYEDYERIVAINMRGVFAGVKHGAEAMRRGGQGGSIVNIASIAGILGFAGVSPYTMAKHGVVGLTKVAAIELAPENIRVNAVCPGLIKTRMAQDLVKGLGGGAEVEAGLEAAHPMGRGGQPEEVAEMNLWLASDRSSFSTGGTFTVDGGFSAQ